ncbi:cytochrome P450 [Mycena olivaceomarginata]|nr:cytochrome P450 [Mycena olivaceomarginata]
MNSGILLACGVVLITARYLFVRRRSTIKDIRGPPSPSWIFGNMLQLLVPPNYGDYEFNWQRVYGAVYRVKGVFGQDRLLLSDPTALQYVLNSPIFEHGPTLENAASVLFEKECVMLAKGETHKRLRAEMHIGFTASVVRDFQTMLEGVAQSMTEELEELQPSLVDICPILSEAMLDTISRALLSHSTQDWGRDFVVNNAQIISAVTVRLPRWVSRAMFHLPTTAFKAIHTAKSFTKEVGERIIHEKMEAGRQGSAGETDVFDMFLNLGPSEKRRNPLTLEEVVAQTGILLVAGQETTTSVLVFGLLELTRHPQFQDQLRSEARSFLGNQSSTSYDNMPLLNAFIKETLRLYPPAALQERVATRDTVIPLADSILTSTGELMNQIAIRKGQVVSMAIASYHRQEPLWGVDVHEFRPSRWLDGTVYQGQALGPYANLLSFIGGPRVCLGWRFA